jgi:signal peptidase I
MLPTYRPGDLVLVRRAAQYGPGDIVAYRVPDDDIGANMILIHRIVDGSPGEGFVLLGDNNEEEDVWNPKDSEIVGRPLIHVSSAGLILTNLRSPLVLASLGAGAAAAVVAVPKAESKPVSRPRGRHVRRGRIWRRSLTRPRGAHLA